ncbi:unnamed protein product [Arctogadus glacialis]
MYGGVPIATGFTKRIVCEHVLRASIMFQDQTQKVTSKVHFVHIHEARFQHPLWFSYDFRPYEMPFLVSAAVGSLPLVSLGIQCFKHKSFIFKDLIRAVQPVYTNHKKTS